LSSHLSAHGLTCALLAPTDTGKMETYPVLWFSGSCYRTRALGRFLDRTLCRYGRFAAPPVLSPRIVALARSESSCWHYRRSISLDLLQSDCPHRSEFFEYFIGYSSWWGRSHVEGSFYPVTRACWLNIDCSTDGNRSKLPLCSQCLPTLCAAEKCKLVLSCVSRQLGHWLSSSVGYCCRHRYVQYLAVSPSTAL